VTSFRLTAGRPAPTYRRGGPAASQDTEITRVADFYPNREPLTPLECGCKIPWPLFTLIGSSRAGHGRQIHCDDHGWQHVADKIIATAKRRMKREQVEGQEELPPF
jgi:hypothetical protein